MLRTVKATIFFIILLSSLFCDNFPNNPAICVDVAENATIKRIGYNPMNSMLSVCFVNELSYCTPGFPYETNRLDVSLMDFEHTYTSNKVENPELLPLPQGSNVLFNGEVSCNDSCRISIPVAQPNVSIVYIKRTAGDIVIELDTNGNKAAEFRIWDYN